MTITYADVLAAHERIKPHLVATPLRNYPELDSLVGHDVRVWVKHENHQPTQSFKIRNGLSAITALPADARAKGVIGASTGNHGLGLAYAGKVLGVRVTICVPANNNPEKNAAIRALGAELVETGVNYDESAAACAKICADRGMTLVHSTNNRDVIAGAGTMTVEILEQHNDLDALLIATGGGSQAVGALCVAAATKPSLAVCAVGAAGAPAQYESWKAGEVLTGRPVNTMAEGIATASAYAMTFDALKNGLREFVAVSEPEIYQAIRDYVRITHNVPEGAGAVGLAGLRKLAPKLAGQHVAIVLCGGNLSQSELRKAICV
ncbi:MAG TPA: threonine/serine dehydratase [Gemmatimonadaceae bacterium]|nr:threonine/serine dehydratase [Gemmatimonadaceae bacterium]